MSKLLPLPDFDRVSFDDLKVFTLQQDGLINALLDDLARAKGLKARPDVKPSGMEDGTDDDRKPGSPRTSKGAKRRKNGGRKGSVRTADLTIHADEILKPPGVPAGSQFKGRKPFVVQDLVLQPHVTRYHREVWKTPDGKLMIAPLPDGLTGHYGPNLIRFILAQSNECNVTEPKLLDQLHAYGIKISLSQLNTLLTENKGEFHDDKREILVTGLEVSSSLTTDDTTARHKKRNCITTQIGNQYFAFFETTDSKSRINFLKIILIAGTTCYRVNEAAAEYWREHNLPEVAVSALMVAAGKSFPDDAAWEKHLTDLGVAGEHHRRTASEGALWAAITEQGLLDGTVIVSDGAPQFDVGDHARCWIHAERLIYRLPCATPEQHKLVKKIRTRVWKLYRALKAYAKADMIDPVAKRRLRAWFERVFTTFTGFAALDEVLDGLLAIREKLLRVLDRPDTPLHTNGSEGDIRARVEKRKISGCTRGDEGLRCRDTFASIIKTLRKHGISFWDYLGSRFHMPGLAVPPIGDIIRAAAAGAG